MSEIYWISTDLLKASHGRLAIVSRPRGEDWLDQELRSLREEGIDVLVSFLEVFEASELGLADEAKYADDVGIDFLNFPISDRQVPDSLIETQAFVRQLVGYLEQGKSIGVHCRQSVGRAGFMAAAILVEIGMNTNDAFSMVKEARGCSVPDTDEQRQWVTKYEKSKEFALAFHE